MEDKEIKSGKPYELLIEKIYRELAPDAEIKQNDYIFGRHTGINRQIDVSIRAKILDDEKLIIVQAKDHKVKADIKIVGEFLSVIEDTNADKGILICSAGFTETAINYAKNRNLEIYSAHTAMSKRWDLELKIPIIRKMHSFNCEYFLSFHALAGDVNKKKDRLEVF